MANQSTNTATDVAVVGSVNLDLVVRVEAVPLVGETVLGDDLREVPGGKGANQAVAASRLGRSVGFVGRVGDDGNGATLRRALTDAEVDTTFLAATADTPSGVALINVERGGDNAIVVSPGANAHLDTADVDAAHDLLSNAKVVLLQLEIPLEAVQRAAGLATGTVILNPAPARPLPNELLDQVDILIPNQTELAALTGFDAPITAQNAAEAASKLPVDSIVVTLGEQGALVIDHGETTAVPAPAITPVDTTAAGDSFCAALASALVEGASLTEAASWAVKVGAATTLRPGAQPSLPTASEVEQLLQGSSI